MNVKLKKEDKVTANHSKAIAEVMQRILAREDRIGKHREHFWVIGLDRQKKLLYVELVAMGKHYSVQVEPMQVYKLALQKNAVDIILCHNHTAENIKPSSPDKDITDKLIQVGNIVEINVIDHIIISPKTKKYFSFEDNGLIEELGKSLMYVPPISQMRAIRKAAMADRNEQIIRNMKANKFTVKMIAKITGLDERLVKRVK